MSLPGERRTSGAVSTVPQATIDDETLEDYEDIFAHIRATDEARARAGDVRGLWTTAGNTISHLSSHFVTEPHVDFSGGWTLQLQNLWHLYYVTGKHCLEDSVAPVILQLIETSQRGLLARHRISSTGAVEIEHAPVVVRVGNSVIQQYLWQDLPFLVPDMTGYWIQDCARMSCSQRERISFFWASLTAASSAPWSFGLCRIALMVLRDTLETQRRLASAGLEPGGEDSENAGRTIDMLTIADLLRAANAWLARAGSRITQLCEAGDSNAATGLTIPVPDDVSALGPLAQAAGIQAVPGGFSSQRWFFWLRRLDEIGAETSPRGLAESSAMGMASPFVQRVREEKQMARRVAYNMVYTASQSNSTIVQELIRMGRVPL
ncbi:putative conserved hypothetical protein [Rosellinia necatrix]|uniref:Uncharacterized protein n=1 Tax=Rosellinia necatrix TaxID=77044 RepID=A0A1W2TRS7_ROSNE|nr:putative conserved hypothetical protein [Rosellinia necatrix]